MGRGPSIRILVVTAALCAGGCEHEEITYYPQSEVIEDSAEPDAPEPDAAGGDVDLGPAPGSVGAACEVDEDCTDDRICVTEEFLQGFGVDTTTIKVPGGMCSQLLCSEDADCGDDGTCFDAETAFGPDAAGITICLRLCDGLSQCRWEEDWSCFPIPEDAAEREVCLSDSMIVAIETDPTLNPPAEE